MTAVEPIARTTRIQRVDGGPAEPIDRDTSVEIYYTEVSVYRDTITVGELLDNLRDSEGSPYVSPHSGALLLHRLPGEAMTRLHDLLANRSDLAEFRGVESRTVDAAQLLDPRA